MISARTAARSDDGWWKMEKIFTNEKCVVFFIISSATYMCMIGISMCAFSLIFWYMKWNETTFQYWLCIYFPSTCLTCVLAKMARNITRLAYLSSIYFACVALSKADLLCFLSLLVFVCVCLCALFTSVSNVWFSILILQINLYEMLLCHEFYHHRANMQTTITENEVDFGLFSCLAVQQIQILMRWNGFVLILLYETCLTRKSSRFV